MKSRLQKKHQRLLAENKLLKGQLGEELKAELGGKPYLSQQELGELKREITGYRREWKGDQVRLNQYGLKLLEQEKTLTETQEDVKRLRSDILIVLGAAALLLFCQIVMMLF